MARRPSSPTAAPRAPAAKGKSAAGKDKSPPKALETARQDGMARPPKGPPFQPGQQPLPLVTSDSDHEVDVPVEALGALLADGIVAEEVPSLVQVQQGMSYFALLRDLVRLGEAEFIVRMAVLAEFASSDRTRWDSDVIARHFVWLTADARASVLRSLRRGGWLEQIEGWHRLTDRGEALYAVLSRIHGIQPQEGDLALGVLNVELSRDLGHESTPALRHLHHNLRRIVDGAEEAIKSHSEVRVIEAQSRISRNLAWARRARSCLDGLDLADDASYRVAQDVGHALSELHQWQAVLQRAGADLTAKRVQLGRSGLSMTDVTAFLMRCDVEILADFGAPMVSTPVQPIFAILDNLLSEAEYEWVQAPSHIDNEGLVGWALGPPEDSLEGQLEVPEFSALDRFVEDIKQLAVKGGAQKLSAFVPRRSWAESAYRLSLLALGESVGRTTGALNDDGTPIDVGDLDVGNAAPEQAVELVSGLSSTPFEVVVSGNGSDKDRVFSDTAAEITRGVVQLRQGMRA